MTRTTACRSVAVALLTLILSAVSGIAQTSSRPPGGDISAPAILGQPCQHPYVVAIPVRDNLLLDRVQTSIPTAFLTDSQFGPYVQAASSPERNELHEITSQLRNAGFDARVAYRPVSCTAPDP